MMDVLPVPMSPTTSTLNRYSFTPSPSAIVQALVRRLGVGDGETVGEATAIITNPTHFAVALRYVPGDAGAPKIIAMGRGKLAERIIKKGEETGITVFRSPVLARAIFFTGDIGQEISDRLYNAVATVLAYVYRLDRGETVPEPLVDVPKDLIFNEDGRPTFKAED